MGTMANTGIPASAENRERPIVLPAGPLEDQLVRAVIAEELDCIRDALEQMGLQLCSDPAIVRGHFDVLQTIDELCQRNENLARTLRAEDMVAACGKITLESLKKRLHHSIRHKQGNSADAR